MTLELHQQVVVDVGGDDLHAAESAVRRGQRPTAYPWFPRGLAPAASSPLSGSRETAQSAGLPMNGRRWVVETANGAAPIIQASADRLEVGSISRADFPIDINDGDQTNVLGMNFLSSLSGWRVEGNYLVLRA